MLLLLLLCVKQLLLVHVLCLHRRAMRLILNHLLLIDSHRVCMRFQLRRRRDRL
jgi:hypothetical protein